MNAVKKVITKSKHTSMATTFAVSFVALAGLGGCGHDPGTRAVTGAGIGVVGAAVLGAPLLAGAAVGAVAGAATTPEPRHESDYGDR